LTFGSLSVLGLGLFALGAADLAAKDIPHERLYSELSEVIRLEDEGVALDVAKRRLPLYLMTTYNFTMDFRSLMCFLKTLDECDRTNLQPLILQYLLAIKETIIQYKTEEFKLWFNEIDEASKAEWLLEYFYSHPSRSIYDRLSIPESWLEQLTWYDGNENPPMTRADKLKQVTSQVNRNDLTFELGVYISNALGAQFVRQHYSKIRCGYFNLVKNSPDGYLSLANDTCEHKTYYISTGDVQALDQLVSRRTCYVAQFDWVDEFGWGSIIGGIVSKMTDEEFKQSLPCRGSCHTCTITDETKLRLHSKTGHGSTDGHVPDENPLCPILVENKQWMKVRTDFYGSDVDSPVVKKWIEMSSKIIDNPNNKGTLVYEGELDVSLYKNDEVTQYSETSDPEFLKQFEKN
jgi:hypothetical protein